MRGRGGTYPALGDVLEPGPAEWDGIPAVFGALHVGVLLLVVSGVAVVGWLPLKLPLEDAHPRNEHRLL